MGTHVIYREPGEGGETKSRRGAGDRARWHEMEEPHETCRFQERNGRKGRQQESSVSPSVIDRIEREEEEKSRADGKQKYPLRAG